MPTNFPSLAEPASDKILQWGEADSLLPQTPLREPFEVIVRPIGDGRRARLALYGSHFLSTWGQRAWEFAVGLIMLEIRPSSLLLVSVFGLCDAAAVVVGGPAVGAFVDSTPRLNAASRMYVLQNTMVAACAITCILLLWTTGGDEFRGILYWGLVVIAVATGSASSIGSLGASLSVEREWTKALCAGDSDNLAKMNAVMKRIDLTCLIASPIMVGVLMSWRLDAAIILIAVWNLAAWWPECALLRRAQRASPALEAPNFICSSNRLETDDFVSGSGSGAPLADPPSLLQLCLHRLRKMFSGMFAYVRQPAVIPACALALLYLTVMSFGTLMTAYLKWRGLGETELSVYRGLGALSGIGATLAFPPVQQRIGLAFTATGAVWAQLLCLALAATPEFLQGTSKQLDTGVSTHVLVTGLVLSRFGLWTFDLAVNQLLQETGYASSLGSIMGVQGSLQSLCQMLSFVAGVVVWQPERFPVLLAGSIVVVMCSAALMTWHAVCRSTCAHVDVPRPAPSEGSPAVPLSP